MAATGLSAVAVAQPRVAVADRGDLALVPYYTVRDQWVTGIHIVNTSDRTQVVKFRFRRATDGMDAMDFNVVMSPKDVYAGRISRDRINGPIRWTSSDTTCVVPEPEKNSKGKSYSITMVRSPLGYDIGAESGYVEIIAMGRPVAETQPIAVAAKHSNNTSTPPLTPLDCAAVNSNFWPDGRLPAPAAAGRAAVPGRRGVAANNATFQPGVPSASHPTIRTGGPNTYTDSGNVLKVSYFIRDETTGIEFGDNAVHIKDFLDVPSITNQKYSIFHGDLNGFDFPDLDGTGLPSGAAAGTIVRNRFNRLRRSDVLGVDSIINEWSTNPANEVQMDWVVTLPGQYLMLKLQQYYDSLGADRAWVPTVDSAGSALENPKCPRRTIGTGAAAVAHCDFRDQPLELEYVAYNREEFAGNPDTGTLVVSPSLPTATATTYLPKVANVITFGGNSKSLLGPSDANVTASLGQPFGWLEARLKPQPDLRVCAWDSAGDTAPTSPGRPPLAALPVTTCTAATGNVPVIGFAAWARQVAANPNASYGRIVEHSYRVPASVPVPVPAPVAPTGLSVTAGNAQVTVSWTGVSGATRYTVYYSTSTISDITASSVRSVSTTGTSITLTALTNDTQYYVRVTVTTAGGESAASSEASATPQVPVPGAPTGITVTAGNAQVAVSWTAVSGATSYTVYYSTSPITSLTAPGVTAVRNLTGTTATVTGLTNDTPYYVRVTATTAGGESPASAQASVTTAPGLRLSADSGRVTVSWPAVSGASSYSLYYAKSPLDGVLSFEGSGAARAKAAAGQAEGTLLIAPRRARSKAVDLTRTDITRVVNVTSPHTVTGLDNGATYYFLLTATDATGAERAVWTQARATPTLVPGFVVFRDALSGGGEGPQMVVLPTGSFQMGSPSTETGRYSNEGPVRTVTISKRIAMGRYEVTFDDYDRFAEATNRTKPGDSGWGRGSRPVINVSWNEAKAYAAWLSAQTGKTYRLPSESEWEYAARAGTRTRYSWGDSISCSQARYGLYVDRQVRDGAECSNRPDGTVPVGSFAANGFGLFDMHGNVQEWVEDCWHDNYEGAPTDGSAWTTGCESASAVVRGGSWIEDSRNLRAANRFRFWPSVRYYDYGFRLVQDLTASAKLPVPANLQVTAGNAQVALIWTAVTGATSYTVYYSTSPIIDLTATGVRSVNVIGIGHTVTGLPNGTQHFFKVTASNAAGESPASNEASATPQAPGSRTVFRDALKDGGQGPEMVVLPTGSFRMGSPSIETHHDSDEGPVRTVNISQRIAMGRYEVTFAEYDRFADATGRTKPGDSGWGRGSRPVINVSWNDAKAYATWLSTQTGKTYRLPSEAEWEYAVRVGTVTRYSWGDSIDCSQARYGRLFGGECSNSRDGTAPVGSFAANGFGLFDMHGNVWEWVEDCWHNNYQGAPTDGRAWTTNCDGSRRAVVRGGSWLGSPRILRAANRSWDLPSVRSYSLGFRLVQDLNP